MKFKNYLKLNENNIQKGLSIDEPEINGKYNKEYIQKRISILQIALKDIKKKEDSKSNNAITNDITDKLDKWKNVDRETKPAGPSIPAEILAGLEGEEGEEENKKDKEEE